MLVNNLVLSPLLHVLWLDPKTFSLLFLALIRRKILNLPRVAVDQILQQLGEFIQGAISRPRKTLRFD
jgi:hypothetical protein